MFHTGGDLLKKDGWIIVIFITQFHKHCRNIYTAVIYNEEDNISLIVVKDCVW